MKKKYKIKKIYKYLLIFILLIILIIHITNNFKSRSYSIEYKIEDYNISENFDKDSNIYFYTIKYNGLEYDFISNINYVQEKRLIKNIEEHKNGEYICLTIKSEYIKTNPLCSLNERLIDFRLIPIELQKELADYFINVDELDEEYQNYTIYNKDNNLLIWNYKGFNYLNDKKINNIEVFTKDIYDIPIVAKVENYILLPDYEQEYNFNTFYIVSLEDKKAIKWQTKYEISFDSYILGTHEKSIYLVDRQNKIEYEIVPHKQKLRIVGTGNKTGTIYENGEFKKISLNKLISSDYQFKDQKQYNFFIKDNKLYLSYFDSKNEILVSNKKITNLISYSNDNAYYLVDDTLFKYNLKYGEIKLIKYSEWKNNNINKIIIDN